MPDISRQPDFACFSHTHTLQTSFQFSSHVSHHTTHSHTHDHTHTLSVFPIQTSHHSPHLSPLPSLSLQILPPLHPRFPLAFFPIHLSHSSSIHILSSTFYLFLSIPLHSTIPSQNISILRDRGLCPPCAPHRGLCPPLAPWPPAQGAPPPVSPPAYGAIGHVTSFDM